MLLSFKRRATAAAIDANWDVTQPSGEKIEFGETLRHDTIRRPDRMRVEDHLPETELVACSCSTARSSQSDVDLGSTRRRPPGLARSRRRASSI